MEKHYYIVMPSPFGEFGVVWREAEDGPKVTRICLPGSLDAIAEEVQKFLLPVIVSNAQRFELLKDSEKASLYRVRKPNEF